MNHDFFSDTRQQCLRHWCLVVLLLWLLPVAGGQAASPDEVFPRPLRVVMDRNHPPFIHVDATGKIQGILADQWLLWQEKTGIPVEITGLDRHDALSEMRAGRFDVIDTPFVTEEGQEWLEFGKPYADVEVAIFFHENIGGISDIRSLRGFVVGAKEGDAAVEQLRSEGINSLMLFKGYEAMIEAALEHKINVFVADKPPAAYYLDKHGVRSDFKLSAPINIGEFHRAVRRGSGGLLTEVEAGFARISTEELERIDKKWSIPPQVLELPVIPLLVGASILVLVIASLLYWNRTLRAAVKRRTAELESSEQALLASEATCRNIVQALPMGIHIYDLLADGRLVLADANPAADHQLGMEHVRLVGTILEDCLPGLRETDLPLNFRRVAELGEAWPHGRFEYADDAVAGVFELYAFQMSTNRMAILFNEISARKRAEEERNKLEAQLVQVRKMESIGQLAGGVAHDFNNMLGVIIGHCELALDGLNTAYPLYAPLQNIRQAAARSADLTRQLLAFARKQPVAPEELDLNVTVSQTLSILQRLVGEGIELVWRPGQNVGQVRIDPSQLDQILANLLANARDAIGDTGTVTIKTAMVTLDARCCTGQADRVPGDYVQLAVSDNGCGMSGETLSRLFEPFYTTKALGKGTGLGLATVNGIVRQNNGFIKVDSELGWGSTFKIYLPRLASPEEQKPDAESVSPASGSETILLVEDECMILEITKAMLHKLGYTVLAASGPEEAMRLASEHGRAIDLLLIDVVMPGMNGRMLAKNLLATNPGLKCLFMSGYTANVVAQYGVLDSGVHFIHKPFALTALAVKIREALAE